MGFMDTPLERTYKGYMECFSHFIKLAFEASRSGFSTEYCNMLEDTAYLWKERADRARDNDSQSTDTKPK
jgi:hypothetical protein